MFLAICVPLGSWAPRGQNCMTMVNSSSPNLAAGKGACPPASIPLPVCGADIVVQSLVNHGVDTIFAYPGGASIPLHQAFTRFRDKLRVILPRHEQGGGFAAQGYARSTGKIGVCVATSGPGATNLVTTIADAKLDSIPMLAITGQVSTSVIGTDAFQETPIVEVCRSVTKHHYLVTHVDDIARVMREAFHIATTGRPGPVLIDLPKNVQLAQTVPDYNAPMNLPGYHVEQYRATPAQIAELAALIGRAKRPVIYAGGGIIASGASEELVALVRKTGIPVTTTIMGLGAFPGDDPLSLSFLGMHGTVYANYAVDNCDLLLALGVRFDDRVTGKVSEFAARSHDRAYRRRSVGNQQDQEGPVADLQRREVRSGRVEQDRPTARRPQRVASQDRRLEEDRPAGL